MSKEYLDTFTFGVFAVVMSLLFVLPLFVVGMLLAVTSLSPFFALPFGCLVTAIYCYFIGYTINRIVEGK